MEALIASMIAAGPEAKRPPHIWLLVFSSLIVLTALEFNMADKNPAPDRTEPPAARGGRRPAALAGAVFAAVLLVAGGIGLYVIGRPAGNNATAQTAAADVHCADRAAEAAELGKSAVGEVAAMLAADPPQDLSSLAFNAPDGSKTTLADFSGKVVLVNLWATWCVPCRSEMPALDDLQKAMGGKDFQVVAVNVDTGSPDKSQEFLRDVHVENLAFYRDDSLDLFNDVKKRGLALGLPVSMLVGRDGCLLASMNGPAAWASADAKSWLEKAVGNGA